MNLKTITTILIGFLLFPTNSNSQDFKVTLGEIHKNPAKSWISSLLGEKDGGIYAIRIKGGLLTYSSKSDRYLEYYDSKLKIKKSKLISLPDKSLEYFKFAYFNDKLFCFLIRYDKKEKTNTLYGTDIDENGKVNNKMVEISKVEVDGKRSRNDFDIRVSPDSTKFLIINIPDYERKATQKVELKILDTEYKEFETIAIEFPYKDKDFGFHSFAIDTIGNIHMLAEVKKETKEKGTSRYEYKIYTYFKKSESLHEYKVELNKNYISRISMKIDKMNNLVCAGFYSDKNSFNMKGIFYMRINPDIKDVDVIKTTDFTKNFLQLFMSERRAKKQKGLHHLVIRGLVLKEDGGIILLSEYYHYYTTTTTDSRGNTRTTHHYVYNDIVVANIDKSGTIEWWTHIPKNQHTTNDGGPFSSFSYALKEDKIHIIFNEHKKLVNDLSPEKRRNVPFRKSITVLVTIDTKGKAKKKPLFQAKEGKTIVRPKFYLQSSNNQLIMFAQLSKSYRFVKMNF